MDKLVGDQVMAFFGAPIGRDDHAKRAVATAGEIMGESLTAASVDRLGIGIGIATGAAFVGNVGGGEVADYTVIGDTVNVAARLQSEAAAGEILISQETYARVAREFLSPSAMSFCSKAKASRWSPGRSPRTLKPCCVDCAVG